MQHLVYVLYIKSIIVHSKEILYLYICLLYFNGVSLISNFSRIIDSANLAPSYLLSLCGSGLITLFPVSLPPTKQSEGKDFEQFGQKYRKVPVAMSFNVRKAASVSRINCAAIWSITVGQTTIQTKPTVSDAMVAIYTIIFIL